MCTIPFAAMAVAQRSSCLGDDLHLSSLDLVDDLTGLFEPAPGNTSRHHAFPVLRIGSGSIRSTLTNGRGSFPAHKCLYKYDRRVEPRDAAHRYRFETVLRRDNEDTLR